MPTIDSTWDGGGGGVWPPPLSTERDDAGADVAGGDDDDDDDETFVRLVRRVGCWNARLVLELTIKHKTETTVTATCLL